MCHNLIKEGAPKRIQCSGNQQSGVSTVLGTAGDSTLVASFAFLLEILPPESIKDVSHEIGAKIMARLKPVNQTFKSHNGPAHDGAKALLHQSSVHTWV